VFNAVRKGQRRTKKTGRKATAGKSEREQLQLQIARDSSSSISSGDGGGGGGGGGTAGKKKDGKKQKEEAKPGTLSSSRLSLLPLALLLI